MKRLLFTSGIIAVAFWSLGPFLWQVITSLKPEEELGILPPLLPSSPTLANYKMIFRDSRFLRVILTSAIVASCTTALSISIGAPAAFALAKLKVSFKPFILLFVLSASMFPPIATVSPLYLIISRLNLRDTWLALIITYTTFSLPLTIWILTNFFRRIPDEIYFAARLDGCGLLAAFVKIMLPLAAPGVFTAALLVFIFSWNEFLFALTFTATAASRTIPVAIALFPGLHEIPWGEISAASAVVTLPLAVLVFLFQHRIVEGLTAGAVKG
jgi:multiple sugar transport system permease protein